MSDDTRLPIALPSHLAGTEPDWRALAVHWQARAEALEAERAALLKVASLATHIAYLAAAMPHAWARDHANYRDEIGRLNDALEAVEALSDDLRVALEAPHGR